MTRSIRIAAVLLSAFMLLSIQVFADADPPGRVARLSYISGDVSLQPGGVDDWTVARLNRPLTSGDRLWTARDARAEMQTGNTSLRLNGEASFTLANLDDRRVQIQIAQGALHVRVWKLYEDETIEVDTPNFTANLLRPGDYRIDVDNEGDVSWITVLSGTAEANGAGQAVTVQSRQQVRFAGANSGTYDVASAPPLDGFDEWSLARDRRLQDVRSARYVSPGVIGYEDLDDYGTWRVYDAYGPVWVPARVVPGWAPYRFGHWEWIYPWGWTWIDDAPWGFAPFHYGRWLYSRWGWAWVPGPIRIRPYYAPALVAWIGGHHWGVGLSFGSSIGWLPLGPREVYVPWYRASRRYWSNVNVSNTYIRNTNITNIYNTYNNYNIHKGKDCSGGCGNGRTIANANYVNRMAPNGVTVVNHDAFVNSRPVSRSTLKISADAARRAPVVSSIAATPARAGVLGGAQASSMHRPPEKALARPMVTRMAPPRPTPLNFQSDRTGRANLDLTRAASPVTIGRTDASPRMSVPQAGTEASNRMAIRSLRTVPRPDSPITSGDRARSEPARRVVPRPPDLRSVSTRDIPRTRSDEARNAVATERGDRTVVRPPAGRVVRGTGTGIAPRSSRPETRVSDMRVGRIPQEGMERPSYQSSGRVSSIAERQVRAAGELPMSRANRAPSATIRGGNVGGRGPAHIQQAPRQNTGRGDGHARQR